VRDGDTLALLCFRIYGDSACYIDVAKLNGLDRIEPLKAGTALKFPERS
jgi:phage tail protein X